MKKIIYIIIVLLILIISYISINYFKEDVIGKKLDKVNVKQTQSKPPNDVRNIQVINNEIFSLNENYKKSSGVNQKDYLKKFKAKAIDRKKLMLELIEKDSSLFLLNALSKEKVNQFPLEVQSYFEQEALIKGQIEVLHFDDFKNKKSTNKYFIQTEKYKLEFFSVGIPLSLVSGTEIKLKGYQLDNKFVSFTDKNNFNGVGYSLEIFFKILSH